MKLLKFFDQINCFRFYKRKKHKMQKKMIKQRIKCTKKKAYIMFNDYAFFYNLLFSVFEARIFQESVAFNILKNITYLLEICNPLPF